jgi:hypothetical protein
MNSTDEEWEFYGREPDPQRAPLISLRNGTRFNFSTLKYDFALEQKEDADKDIEKQDYRWIYRTGRLGFINS